MQKGENLNHAWKILGVETYKCSKITWQEENKDCFGGQECVLLVSKMGRLCQGQQTTRLCRQNQCWKKDLKAFEFLGWLQLNILYKMWLFAVMCVVFFLFLATVVSADTQVLLPWNPKRSKVSYFQPRVGQGKGLHALPADGKFAF